MGSTESRFTDSQIDDWVKRHDLKFGGLMDARACFEDARSAGQAEQERADEIVFNNGNPENSAWMKSGLTTGVNKERKPDRVTREITSAEGLGGHMGQKIRVCSMCDERFDENDLKQKKEHEHPEPQSGPAREAWFKSGLPYAEWIEQTREGRCWDQENKKIAGERDSADVQKTFDQVKARCGDDLAKWKNAYWNCLSDLSELREALKLDERKTKDGIDVLCPTGDFHCISCDRELAKSERAKSERATMLDGIGREGVCIDCADSFHEAQDAVNDYVRVKIRAEKKVLDLQEVFKLAERKGEE